MAQEPSTQTEIVEFFDCSAEFALGVAKFDEDQDVLRIQIRYEYRPKRTMGKDPVAFNGPAEIEVRRLWAGDLDLVTGAEGKQMRDMRILAAELTGIPAATLSRMDIRDYLSVQQAVALQLGKSQQTGGS